MYNSLRGTMTKKSIALLGAVATVVLACASEPEVRRTEARHAKRARPSGWATGEVQGDDRSMGSGVGHVWLRSRGNGWLNLPLARIVCPVVRRHLLRRAPVRASMFSGQPPGGCVDWSPQPPSDPPNSHAGFIQFLSSGSMARARP